MQTYLLFITQKNRSCEEIAIDFFSSLAIISVIVLIIFLSRKLFVEILGPLNKLVHSMFIIFLSFCIFYSCVTLHSWLEGKICYYF